jgi:hypothetical protein
VNSTWRNNRAGIVPNTLDGEELAPQRGAVIAGNHVYANGDSNTPSSNDIWDLTFGAGITIGGGSDNLITRNLVEDNLTAGIVVTLFVDENTWPAENNVVSDNVSRNHEADLVLLVDDSDSPDGNCFEGNDWATSMPVDLETVAACGVDGPIGELPLFTLLIAKATEPVDHTTLPEPGPQPTMPDADTAPARTADVIPEVDDFDLESIAMPEGA